MQKRKEKEKFCGLLSGDVVRKYKSLKLITDLTSGKFIRSKKRSLKRHQRRKQIKEKITSFFESDENSRLCPGKKDFISRSKIKRQKRYLNDNLKNLYKKIVASRSNFQISYPTFCRFKPF